MTLTNGDASGWRCSCTSCLCKNTSECPLEEIIYMISYINRLYYGTYLPLREKKINELIKTIAECNALPSLPKSNTSLSLKKYIKGNNQTRQFFDTSGITLEVDNLIDRNNQWCTKLNNYYANNYVNNELRLYNLQLYSRKSAPSNYSCDDRWRTNSKRMTGNARSRRTMCLKQEYQPEYKNKFETCTYPRSYSLHEIGRKAKKQFSTFECNQSFNGYSFAKYTPSKNVRIMNQLSLSTIFPKANDSNCSANTCTSVYTFFDSFLLQSCSTNSLCTSANTSYSYTVLLVPSTIAQSIDHQENQFERQLRRLKSVFGPYSQIQAVYNVTEQKKEKGTSQQFKQRSQGISTVSSSQHGTDGSSTGNAKRRAIKIESNVSFSIEFNSKQKGTASDISDHEEVAKPKEKSKGSKKSLHRCFCTMSFPTEGRKPEECASGVCVPGKCTPDKCFARIEKKYGKKKKKSSSDVSSSQASQTRKTKGKDERAGKETFVKDKGSSSISKYKESVETAPVTEKETFATKMNNCCKKLKCWGRGEKKPIGLKHAVTDTDIAGKAAGKKAPYGSKAASQADQKKGKGKKEKATKDSKKEPPKKESKETKKKGDGDKKTAEKKGKKAVDEKGKKAVDEKGKKAVDEKGKKAVDEKGKKAADVKGKKASKEDVKDKATEPAKKGKKLKPLKPYECEPGVCVPKVCSPQTCYERKFPPLAKKEGPVTLQAKIQKCLRKCCRKPPLGETTDKKTGDAATQSRKDGGPDRAAELTVYKDKGSSGKKVKSDGKKQKQKGEGPPDLTTQQPMTPQAKGRKSARKAGQPRVDAGVPQATPMDSGATKGQQKGPQVQYFQNVDSELNTKRQGVNIGSECTCSVEFYKMLF